MELRKAFAPAASWLLPSGFRSRCYSPGWLKDHIDLSIRENEDALCIKTHPLPYLELQFKMANHLPVRLDIYGVFTEIWLGKPVVQFFSSLSDSLFPNETRETMRAYTFLNNFQSELLNPPSKSSIPPNVSINLTAYCRSSLGTVEKAVNVTWSAPRILP